MIQALQPVRKRGNFIRIAIKSASCTGRRWELSEHEVFLNYPACWCTCGQQTFTHMKFICPVYYTQYNQHIINVITLCDNCFIYLLIPILPLQEGFVSDNSPLCHVQHWQSEYTICTVNSCWKFIHFSRLIMIILYHLAQKTCI